MKKMRNVRPSEMSGLRFVALAIVVGCRLPCRRALRFVKNHVIGRDRYWRFVSRPWADMKHNVWAIALHEGWLELQETS